MSHIIHGNNCNTQASCWHSADSFRLTFVVWQFSYDPCRFVRVQVNIQSMTESLWVQVTPCSNHICWRQATLSPSNMRHDVHCIGGRDTEQMWLCERANCGTILEESVFYRYRPGCDAMSITALELRCASFGTIPLYKSTFVWTTLAYDCSLLHAFAVTTTTLEPAEADKSKTGDP